MRSAMMPHPSLGGEMKPILALDLGRVRIGVAISDELQSLAHPLETIPADEICNDAASIAWRRNETDSRARLGPRPHRCRHLRRAAVAGASAGDHSSR